MRRGRVLSAELRVTLASVAGGRLTAQSGGYADADRTDEFTRAIAATHPDVIIISELDCSPGARQLGRLAHGLTEPAAALHSEAFSASHIPGVDKLGVGIASRYRLHQPTSWPDRFTPSTWRGTATALNTPTRTVTANSSACPRPSSSAANSTGSACAGRSSPAI